MGLVGLKFVMTDNVFGGRESFIGVRDSLVEQEKLFPWSSEEFDIGVNVDYELKVNGLVGKAGGRSSERIKELESTIEGFENWRSDFGELECESLKWSAVTKGRQRISESQFDMCSKNYP